MPQRSRRAQCDAYTAHIWLAKIKTFKNFFLRIEQLKICN